MTLRHSAFVLYKTITIAGLVFQFLFMGYFLFSIYFIPNPDQQPRFDLILAYLLLLPFLVASWVNVLIYALIFQDRKILYTNLVWIGILGLLYLPRI